MSDQDTVEVDGTEISVDTIKEHLPDEVLANTRTFWIGNDEYEVPKDVVREARENFDSTDRAAFVTFETVDGTLLAAISDGYRDGDARIVRAADVTLADTDDGGERWKGVSCAFDHHFVSVFGAP